jgi:hypothetical protein
MALTQAGLISRIHIAGLVMKIGVMRLLGAKTNLIVNKLCLPDGH